MNCPKCEKETVRKEIVFTDWVSYYIPEYEYWECGCGWKSETKEIPKPFWTRVKNKLSSFFFD